MESDSAAPTCPATEGRMPIMNLARGATRSVMAPAIGIEIIITTMNLVIGRPMASSRLRLAIGVYRSLKNNGRNGRDNSCDNMNRNRGTRTSIGERGTSVSSEPGVVKRNRSPSAVTTSLMRCCTLRSSCTARASSASSDRLANAELTPYTVLL